MADQVLKEFHLYRIMQQAPESEIWEVKSHNPNLQNITSQMNSLMDEYLPKGYNYRLIDNHEKNMRDPSTRETWREITETVLISSVPGEENTVLSQTSTRINKG